ncbi:beta-ketoacyl-ACP synthase [Corynebacterium diphtheriae subsp. lausannense]|nr:beta-ketoacyl-ACP synthase [Corynebacterium diphtheriae subsp. lausannense]
MPLHGQHLSALRVLKPEKEGEQLTSQSPDHAKEGFIFGFLRRGLCVFYLLFLTSCLTTSPVAATAT